MGTNVQPFDILTQTAAKNTDLILVRTRNLS